MMNRFDTVAKPIDESRRTVKTIKVNHLYANSACPSFVNKFNESFPIAEFPDGVEPTVERCVAAKDDFDFHWAARVFLTPEASEKFQVETDTEMATLADEYLAKQRVIAGVHQANVADWRAEWPVDDRYGEAAGEAFQKLLDARDAAAETELNYPGNESKARRFAELFADDANVHENFDVAGEYETPRPNPAPIAG